MNFLFEALLKLAPNADFYIENNVLTWNSSDIPQPSEEEIQSKIAELEAAKPLRLLRIQRNQLLQESDWRDLPSYPGTDQAEWRTYRQALRDLTNTETPSLNDNGELINVNWPVPPGESNGS